MSELREGDRIGERYVLERRLGIGGMGEVWLAELEGAGAFRRSVVIKVLAPDRRGDDRIALMLADEARVVGLLHHPGIVSALDYLESEKDGPIFVLEYVDGTSLRSALRHARVRKEVMPEQLAAYVGSQVARALHAAHSACAADGTPLRVVHRDVSPDNVLLSRSGAVYIGDFGVARAAGNSDVSSPGAPPKGKVGYMPPEQAAGQPVGPQADVFSLGRVIAEAADVNCGPALRSVIDKATAPKAADRFASAAELAAALIQVCPPPADADGALSAWLHRVAPDALGVRRTSQGDEPAPKPFRLDLSTGRIIDTPPKPLFASVPPPRGPAMRVAAASGVVLALLLPLGLLVAEAQHAGLIHLGRRPGFHAPVGALNVRSRPDGAEVYVDGALRGLAPLQLELPAGQHALRVGSPKLERWRATSVNVKVDAVLALEIDLTE